MTMTTIASDQWACRSRTWFRFRWRPGGKLRGFPWWAKHRWRGVQATGGDIGLAGGVHRHLTMTCTRCGLPEEIRITDLAEFLLAADIKLPHAVKLELGLTPPELKKPLLARWARAAGRFVGRSRRTAGRLVRLGLLIAAAPALVPIRLYKDWHLRRMTYLRGLAHLKAMKAQAITDTHDRVGIIDGEVGALQEQVSDLDGRMTHQERRANAQIQRIERLEERPIASGSALCVSCKRSPEECAICHHCVGCSDRIGIQRDEFLGTHRHIDERGIGADHATFGRSF